MRPRRKLALVVLGCLFGLVALEIVLQIVSYVAWLREPAAPAQPRDAAAHVLLCVGDSFTQGLGASDSTRSYPRRTEAWLAAHTLDSQWQVFNCGRSGSNSKELLARLPRQIEDYRPDLVYVLTGYNDFWSRREPTEGFPIEFRTARLLSMIFRGLGDRGDAGGRAAAFRRPGTAPFLGYWHAGDVWFRFTSEGRIESSGGELDLYWTWRPGEMLLRHRARDEDVIADWELADGTLVVSGGFLPGELRLSAGPLLRDDLDRARHALREDDLDRARELFESCLTDGASRFAALRGLVSVHARRGDRRLAGEWLDRLRDGYLARPDPRRLRALIDANLEVGEVDRAFVLVGEVLVSGNLDDAIVHLLLRRGLEVDDRGPLLSSIDRALERDDVGDDLRIALLGAKAELRDDEPSVAVRCLIEAYRIRADDVLFKKTVLRDPDRFTAQQFEQALEDLQLDVAERARLRDVFRASVAAEDRTADVLAGSLHRIVRTCRAAGAEPVLLTYPIRHPEVEKVVAEVAAALDVGWIDVRAKFDVLLRNAESSDYFILDGHCNDRGYAVLGELVGADALERLR